MDPLVRALALVCESSPFLARGLRDAPFQGRCRIVAAMRRAPFSAQKDVVCDGLHFDLDLAEDIQRSIYFGCYETRDLALIAPLVPAGGTCLDVGANVGFYTLHFARRVGVGGRVFAFEPDPRNVSKLRRNVDLNGFGDRVRIQQEAISDHPGYATLHRSDVAHSGLGSLAPHAHEAASVDVPVTSLDDFIAQAGIERVDLLKADVEGYELQLLHGVWRSLDRRLIHRVFIEFNGVRLADRSLGFAHFVEPLERAGYRPAAVHADLVQRMKRGGVPPSAVWPRLLFEAP